MAGSTTVGILRVLLTANSSEFDKTMDRSAASVLRVNDAAKKGTSGLSALAGGASSATSSTGFLNLGLASLARIIPTIAIGSLVNGFVNATSRLTDLSAQTGINVTSLQRLQYAGGQVGVTLDQIATGIGQLQNRLASGDKSAVAAMEQLGLSFDKIRHLDFGTQLEIISAEISKIPDPAIRTQVAMDLLGRTGISLLPALTSNMKELGDKAERLHIVMSEKTIKSGDALGDSWATLKGVGTGLLATVLGPMADLVNGDAEAWLRLGVNINGVKDNISDLTYAWQLMRGQLGQPIPGGSPLKPIIDATPDLLTNLDAIEAELGRTYAAQIKAGDGARTHAAAVEVLLLSVDRSAAELFRFSSFMPTATSGWEGWIQAGIEANGMMAEGIPLFYEMAAGTRAVGVELDTGTFSLNGWLTSLAQLPAETLNAASASQVFGDTLKDSLSATLAGLPQLMQNALTGGGGMTGFLQAAGSQIGSGLGSSIAKALADSIPSWLGQMLPGIGSLLGPLMGWVSNRLRGGEEGIHVNPARDVFLQSYEAGGAHEALGVGTHAGQSSLAAQLMAAGAGEGGGALMDAIFNADTMAEFNAAMADATDFLAAHQDQLEETAAVADAAHEEEMANIDEARQARIDAAQDQVDTAQGVVDQLQGQFDSLAQSIADEVEEAEMGVIESQVRDQMAALAVEQEAAQQQLADAQQALHDATAEDAAEADAALVDLETTIQESADTTETVAQANTDRMLEWIDRGINPSADALAGVVDWAGRVGDAIEDAAIRGITALGPLYDMTMLVAQGASPSGFMGIREQARLAGLQIEGMSEDAIRELVRLYRQTAENADALHGLDWKGALHGKDWKGYSSPLADGSSGSLTRPSDGVGSGGGALTVNIDTINFGREVDPKDQSSVKTGIRQVAFGVFTEVGKDGRLKTFAQQQMGMRP